MRHLCLEENKVVYWIVVGSLAVVLIAAYIALFVWSRKRQKRFDEQYNSAKERHEVFVLNKKMVKEKPKTGMFKFIKVKTYQVVGRVNLSQAVKGITMNRMQVVTFQTTKEEYGKIQPNHRYKMDVAGNYIGNVIAPPPQKKKGVKTDAGKSVVKRGFFRRKTETAAKPSKQSNKSDKNKA